MSKSDCASGQIAPRRLNNWPDRTASSRRRVTISHQNEPVATRCRTCGYQYSGLSPTVRLIGTYLASALALTAQYQMPACGGFMHTDTVLIVRLLRQCNVSAGSAEQLLQWLKQASSLCCQSHGDAVSAPLVQGLMAEFGPVFSTLATLNADPAQKAACQQLCNQVCLFYRALNSFCDNTASQQPSQPLIALCSANCSTTAPDHGSTATTTQSAAEWMPNFNRYD